MQVFNQKYIYSIVKKALREDLEPYGDITTRILKNKNTKIKAKIIAKQNGVIAGLIFCRTAFKLIGRETIFVPKVKDGSQVKKGTIIAIVRAKVKTILTAERTALNFLNRASGIATTTNQFVKISNKKIKVCCTRKTTPNLRLLEKYAVRKGGGGVSSSTRFAVGGGSNSSSPNGINVIDYVSFATTGDAVDFGDLTAAKNPYAGCSNAHGGL